MTVRIVLPSSVLLEQSDVTRVVVETLSGSIGVLPHRLDGVAVLVPGILTFDEANGGEQHVAVDQGILIKTGLDVQVSVRRAVRGSDLTQLHSAVELEFRHLDEREQSARTVMERLESGLLHRFARFHRE